MFLITDMGKGFNLSFYSLPFEKSSFFLSLRLNQKTYSSTCAINGLEYMMRDP